MATLLEHREQLNLTQEELSDKSGLSVRTIQRIEAGTIPKGHTLKALCKALEIEESQLIEKGEKVQELNFTRIKLINLSSLLFFIPLGNIWIPLLLMHLMKEVNPITKQIISLQIMLSISSAVLFGLSPFVKKWLDLDSQFVLVVLILCILANIFITLRNTVQLDKHKELYIRLNFNII